MRSSTGKTPEKARQDKTTKEWLNALWMNFLLLYLKTQDDDETSTD